VATKRKAAPEPTPLEALDGLLPKLTHRNLIVAIVRLMDGGRCARLQLRRRALPADVANEARVFVEDLSNLTSVFALPKRAGEAGRLISLARARVTDAVAAVHA
jgi:hypothetical protein